MELQKRLKIAFLKELKNNHISGETGHLLHRSRKPTQRSGNLILQMNKRRLYYFTDLGFPHCINKLLSSA